MNDGLINIKKIIDYKKVDDIDNALRDNFAQATFDCDGCFKIKDGGYILLDFGKEISGGVFIVTQSIIANDNAQYRIVFGESVGEAMSELGENNSVNHHSVRDMTIPAVNMSMQTIGDTGFRFVKIQALNADITVRAVKAASKINKARAVGNFKCNDELLNKIWETGAYTVLLNMNDYIWDGVKRDRLVWAGDMHPEVSVISAVFGDDNSIRNSLRMLRNITPKGKWMNDTPTYSMWWLIIQNDYYMHWGNRDFLEENKDAIIQISDQLIELKENGFKPGPTPVTFFVDWSSAGQPCEQEGVNALIGMALRASGNMMSLSGDEEQAKKYIEYSDKIACEEIGISEINNRIAALMYLSGKRDKEIEEIVKNTTVNEMSCFLGYYILKALSLCEKQNHALDIIRNYWGLMLKMGATSFWEEFKPEWAENASRIDELPEDKKAYIHRDFGEHCYKKYRLSLCHGWASGPTAFLMEQIGGITILEPGCKKMRIAPKPGGLEWFDIKYPTPYGTMSISYKKENEKENIKIDAPKEIEIVR